MNEDAEIYPNDRMSTLGMDLMDVANDAWTDLLKERVAERLKGEDDGRLDKLADLLVDVSKRFWKAKLDIVDMGPEFFESIGQEADRILKGENRKA